MKHNVSEFLFVLVFVYPRIMVLARVMVLACVLVLACAMILVHISFAQLVPRFLPSLSLRKFLAKNNNFEMNCCHPNKTIEIGLFQENLQRLLKTHTRVFLFQNACKDFSLRQEQIQNRLSLKYLDLNSRALFIKSSICYTDGFSVC